MIIFFNVVIISLGADYADYTVFIFKSLKTFRVNPRNPCL